MRFVCRFVCRTPRDERHHRKRIKPHICLATTRYYLTGRGREFHVVDLDGFLRFANSTRDGASFAAAFGPRLDEPASV
jgi:hypothetical protein